MVGESQETVGAGVGGSQAAGSNKLPTLSEYGTNLTQQALEVRACAGGQFCGWQHVMGAHASMVHGMGWVRRCIAPQAFSMQYPLHMHAVFDHHHRHLFCY